MEKETFQYVTVDAKDVPPPGEFARENAVNFVVEKVPEPEIAPEQSTPPPSLKAGVTTETFWPKVPEPDFPTFDSGRIGRIIPCDNYRDVIPLETSMERRVKKLEEQMDALLQRIADYNFKSAHKI